MFLIPIWIEIWISVNLSSKLQRLQSQPHSSKLRLSSQTLSSEMLSFPHSRASELSSSPTRSISPSSVQRKPSLSVRLTRSSRPSTAKFSVCSSTPSTHTSPGSRLTARREVSDRSSIHSLVILVPRFRRCSDSTCQMQAILREGPASSIQMVSSSTSQ